MERMEEKLIEVLSDHVPYIHPGDESAYTDEETRKAAADAAKAVLAALGLDDLDAAVERAGEALRVEHGSRLDFARAALEAALTATEGRDDG